MFSASIIPSLNENYSRLKELILGIETSVLIQNTKLFRDNSKLKPERDHRRDNYVSPSRGENFERPSYSNNYNQQQYEQSQTFPPPSKNPKFQPTCYKCNQLGHYATDCKSNIGTVTQVKAIDDLEMMGLETSVNSLDPDVILFGRKAMLDVYLDSVKINALLDTGACASVISESAMGRILRQRPKDVRQIFEENPQSYLHNRLIGANGSALTVVNCVCMPIAWGSYPSKIVKFFVVSGLQQDVLIGTNVLQYDDCWIEALGIALKRGSSNSNYCNEKLQNGIGIGFIVPQNGVDAVYDRENVNIVSRVCKSLTVKDEAQKCSKKKDTVAANTTVKVKQRRK
uniref:CCHC-type domain-containing protein n=1 Tax=Panagrolaimus sp. ES5 TaxID=591445 RepID=A0AC34GE85_9BILA